MPQPSVTMPSAPPIRTAYPPSTASDEETQPLTAGLQPYAHGNDSFASQQHQQWGASGAAPPPPMPMPMQQQMQMQPGSYYPPTASGPGFAQPAAYQPK